MVYSAIYISTYWYKPPLKTNKTTAPITAPTTAPITSPTTAPITTNDSNYLPPKTVVQSIENRFINDFSL